MRSWQSFNPLIDEMNLKDCPYKESLDLMVCNVDCNFDPKSCLDAREMV